jgi:peptidoglycan/LPS O-acetylase OafA/YrhL
VRPFDKLSTNGLRPTWSWLWAFLAFALLVVAAGFIAVIALSGNDRNDVLLLVAFIGGPVLLGVFALGTLALVMARPSGARWRAVRRWGLALLGSAALITGLATVAEDAGGAVPLIVAGASALVFLWLDLRRGRDGE